MTREEIIEKVNNLLSEEFEVDLGELTPDANIKETLALDSLSLVDLVALVPTELQNQNSGSGLTQHTNV